MSYDLEVVVKRTIHSDNYTSNVYKMYQEAYKRAVSNADKYKIKSYIVDHVKDWKEAVTEDNQEYSMPVLKGIIEELKRDSKFFKKFNPSNNWGDYDGAVKFLEDAYKAMLISENAYIELDS